MCMWKVLDKELRPLPSQLVGFRPDMQCLDIVSFLESLHNADECGEKLFVVSMDVASAFDSVSAQVLGDVLLERGATTISAAAVERENLELRARPSLGFTKSASFSLDVGMRQGGPRTPSGWNQVMAVLVEELLQLWAGRAPAVSWAPEWVPFEILVWADNIFLVSSSIIDIVKRTQEIADVFGKRGLRFNESSLEILPSKKAETEATRIPFNEGMGFSWVQIWWCSVAIWMDRAQRRRKLRVAWTKGGIQCCVVQEFLRKNVSKRFTPRWLQVSCGVRPLYAGRWVEWFRATKRSAQALRCRLNLPSLWHRALAAVYGWAGHVARKDPSHPGHAAIRWRNAEWWETMKSSGAGSRDQTWRHCRSKAVRCWWWWLGRRTFLRIWPRSLMRISSDCERQLNSIEFQSWFFVVQPD